MTLRATDGGIVKDELLVPGGLPTPAPGSPTTLFPAQYLALDRDGKRLFALLPSESPGATRLAALDTHTWAIQAIYPLGGPDIVYRSLAVGVATGRLYLFGNRDKSAVVTLLSGADGSTVDTWSARSGDDYNWRVYQGAVSADEQHLFLSYHSEDASGVDRFAVTPTGLERCPQNVFSRRFGCLGGHGGFRLYQDGILVATGSNVIEQVDMQGWVRGAFDTMLTNNHLMEFVVDEAAGKLYAAGPCGYAGDSVR